MTGNNVRRRGRDIVYTRDDLHDGAVLRRVSALLRRQGLHIFFATCRPPRIACIIQLTWASPPARLPGVERQGQGGQRRVML